MKNRMLEAAREYALRGWAVFPVHSAQDGQCSCGDDACKNIAKHPRTLRGFKDATTNEEKIEAWWTKWPGANIGIPTGGESGLLVLDNDPRNRGDQSLKELLSGKELPETPTVRTGGKGSQIYFKAPPGRKVRSRTAVLAGLDIKAEGGYVVAPPSSHKSGRRYLWYEGLAPSETELAPVPSWLASQLLEPVRKLATRSVKNQIGIGARHDSLLRMAGALRRQGATPEDIAGALLVVNQNRCEPPLAEEDVQALAQSSEAWTPGNGGIESPYKADDGGIFWLKTTKDGPMPVRLTNFDARIITDIVEDDGVETRRHCEIEAKLLGRTKPFIIPAANFVTMSWAMEQLGAKAVVSPGMGLRDHARAAIQELSAEQAKECRIFTHSGWRKYRGRYVYLHSDGAIDQHGQIVNIKVKLPSSLASLSLPPPPDGEALRSAVRASLEFLRIGPRPLTCPTYAGIWRAPLGQSDFSESITGQTGVGKTVVAALAQQHYGAGFSERNLPGSWSSTGNANEGLAFTAKDTLLVVDDFAPTGTRGDLARYHKEADRIFRAQGNSSGRLRMKSDSTLRNSKPPRGLILSTGEDTPRGQSLRARMLVLELSPNALDWERVTRCQQSASDGLYAQAMAGYLQWLAPRYEATKRKMPERISQFRTEAASSEQHKRTPEIVANLWLGMSYFLRFAVDVGAISEQRSAELRDATWRALGTAAQRQNRHQKEEDPVWRFLELIGAALTANRAHLADAKTGESGTAKGECIGWLEDDLVFLNPETAFGMAQKLANEQGEHLSIAQKTLWRRMDDRGVLAQSEVGRNLVRKTIAGQRRLRLVALGREALGIADQNRDKRDFRDE